MAKQRKLKTRNPEAGSLLLFPPKREAKHNFQRAAKREAVARKEFREGL